MGFLIRKTDKRTQKKKKLTCKHLLSLSLAVFLLTVCPSAVLIKLMQTSLTERTKLLTLQRRGNVGPNDGERRSLCRLGPAESAGGRLAR